MSSEAMQFDAETDDILTSLAHARGEARHRLEAEVVEAHEWLVRELASSYADRGLVDRAEFERLAHAALWSIVRSYDHTSGPFVPLAMIGVIAEVREELQSGTSQPRKASPVLHLRPKDTP